MRIHKPLRDTQRLQDPLTKQLQYNSQIFGQQKWGESCRKKDTQKIFIEDEAFKCGCEINLEEQIGDVLRRDYEGTHVLVTVKYINI